MTSPISQATQNLRQNEPTLAELLELHAKDILLRLNSHHIATIVAFDPVTQTATATVNYKKLFFQFNPLTDQNDPILFPYPLLVQCPVIFLGGGLGNLTFPVIPGDECLALFNDRDIANWLMTGNSQLGPDTLRLHAFSDAILLVGVRSLPRVIPDFNPLATELKFGTTKISLTATGATISVGGTTELTINALGQLSVTNVTGEMVKALFDALTAIIAGTAGGFPFVLPASYATALAKLGSFVAP